MTRSRLGRREGEGYVRLVVRCGVGRPAVEPALTSDTPSTHGLPVRSIRTGLRLRASRRSGAGDHRVVRGPGARRQASGAARRDGLGQDVHDGPGHRARQPADAGDGAQQDARRPALSGVQAVLPAQRGRIFRLLLRLLPARGLRAGHGLVHREGIDDQRRDRPDAAVGHALDLRAARRHHRRQRLVHLRPRIAGGVLRPDAAAGARTADRSGAHPAQAGGNPVRAQRSRLRARRVSRARRRHRGVSVVRRAGRAHRAVRRRGGRADHVRSAHRQDAQAARQAGGLSEVALRHAARDAEAGRGFDQG